MDTRELLGKRVRELRKKKRMTQEQLAEKANVDVKFLGNIERGRENPTFATLEKLAGALGVKTYQILVFEHEVQGKSLLRRQITQILAKCDEKELQIILKLVSAIKD